MIIIVLIQYRRRDFSSLGSEEAGCELPEHCDDGMYWPYKEVTPWEGSVFLLLG
jgi:hypothetical protein